jgi:hypothetical protein
MSEIKYTTTEVKVLGLKIPYQVPADIDSYNALDPNRENAVLEDAISSTIYRAVLNKIRAEVCKHISDKEGIKRFSKMVATKKMDENGQPILREVFTESEKKYVDRVLAKVGKSIEEYRAFVEKVAANTPFNPAEREKKERAVAQLYIDTATQLVGAGFHNNAAAKLSAELGIHVEPTVDSLARALFERERRKNAEKKRQMLIEMGMDPDAVAGVDSDDDEEVEEDDDVE